MKKLSAFIAGIIWCNLVFAGAPQALNYQAVARDVSGAVIPNQLVNLRLTLHSGAWNGTVDFSETDTATTNQFGLFTVKIGTGVPSYSNISSVNWGNADRFLHVEIDVTGGTNFADMGTTQLLSVPYALYAGNCSGSLDTAIYANATGGSSALIESSLYTFLGATASTLVSQGQMVEVTATVTLGSSLSGGAIMNRLSICQQSTVASDPSDNGTDYILGTSVTQDTKLPVTLNTIFTGLAPGTYQFGMGYITGAGHTAGWNSNGWTRVSVKVFNP